MVSKALWSLLLVAPALWSAEAIAAEIEAAESVAVMAEAVAPVASTEVAPIEELSDASNASNLVVAEVPASAAPAESTSVDVEATRVEVLEQIGQYTTSSNANLAQVTSVSQLSDVFPTDWAFQALQSLVERYGCIAGYPDGTFRGRNFATRYELAAALNACLDRISELLAAGDFVTREDLATIQRLQEEFAAELATLRGRVDALEARVTEVEENQFSTTTKLQGRVQFLVSAPFEEDENGVLNDGTPATFNDQVIFVDRVRLNFNTSFTGEDRLLTRLQARNIPTFAGDPIGFQAGGSDNTNDVILDDLIYQFPLGDNVEILIGANGLDIDDFTTSIVTPHGQSSDSGALSEFADPRQYEQGFAGTGAGVGARVGILDNDDFGLSLDFGYVGDEAESPLEGSGFFNGDYSAIGQLTLTTDFVDAAVTYVNAYDDSSFNGIVYNTVAGPAVANTYGGQINFKLFDGVLQIGGGAAYTDVSGIGSRPDFDLWSWQGTLALTDVLGEGNVLGVLAGVPTYTRDLPTQSTDTSFLAEVYYLFNLNDNIQITPSVIWVSDPYNNNQNDDTFIGTIRTLFRF